MAVSLPDWFDVDFLRNSVTVLIVLIIVAAIVVLVFVQDVAWKVLFLGLLVVAAGLLVWYRAELNDCSKTCTCRFIFDDVPCVQT